ncbi:MAG: hypothetical protein ACREJ1_06690, partial [Candidatus Methylomirabilales bacterium]
MSRPAGIRRGSRTASGGDAPVHLHPTAIVSPSATIGPGVTVGPYTVIGDHVSIGEGASVGSHVIIDGWTEIGRGCRIFSHAVLGTEPQDLKFQGEKSRLVIGDHAVIREFT